MDKKREEVYGVGIVFLILSILLSIFTGNQVINSGWNMSSWVLVVFDCVCGVFGIGSLLKPDTFGVVVLRLIENYAKSQERGSSSDSHNSQIQKKSSGSVQVMAHDQSNVRITVSSGKKNAQNLPEQSKNIQDEKEEPLHKETIVVSPSEGYYYDFELAKDDHLKGEIVSTERIDIYFVDSVNYDKWDRGVRFIYEDSNQAVLEAKIDYSAPKKGTWYVLFENNGRKSATVKIHLC